METISLFFYFYYKPEHQSVFSKILAWKALKMNDSEMDIEILSNNNLETPKISMENDDTARKTEFVAAPHSRYAIILIFCCEIGSQVDI